MQTVSLAVLAHVDAGKTTTAEALLYRSGAIRSLGRVDHGDAFFDTHFIERERGITVFSKTAELDLPEAGLKLQLLDTPGHADLAAEAERVLFAADYVLLIISGPDGVQAHTATLWKLLETYRLPVIVWVNKMDICRRGRAEILAELNEQLGEGFADFGAAIQELEKGSCSGAFAEDMAMLSDEAAEEYLASEKLSADTVRKMIRKRRVFPCLFGSALKLEGTDALLRALGVLLSAPERPQEFGARVFKISRDEQDLRLSWIKVTGGSLKLRDVINGEKVTGIR